MRFSPVNSFFETGDSIDSLQLTTTCCNGRWRPSERRARGARTEYVRATASAAERVRAVRPDARAELLSEYESVAARREVCCLLLLVGAHRARWSIVPRCVSHNCWLVRHLAPVYAHSDSRRATFHGLRIFAVARIRRHVLRPHCLRGNLARRVIDRSIALTRHAGRISRSSVKKFSTSINGQSPETSFVYKVSIRGDIYCRRIQSTFRIVSYERKERAFWTRNGVAVTSDTFNGV